MAKEATKFSRKNAVAKEEIKDLSEKIWKNVHQAKQEAYEAIHGGLEYFIFLL